MMAARSSIHQYNQLILPNDRLVIVMVGLPARGKSYMAKKIFRYLRHLQIITKVFNFGSYRRIATKETTVGTASANFFDPDNKEAVKIREQCCLDAIKDLISWFNTGGQIGILDGTNTTIQRRQLIRQFFHKSKSELEYNVSILHIESICNDESIIQNNIISVKLKNPDYCTVDAQKALDDFNERIKMYKKKYVEVGKNEGSYIKVINVGTEVIGYLINKYIECRIFYFLMHLHLHTQNKTQKKPLLMQLKNENESKTDKAMEEKLQKIVEGVGAKFRRPAYDRPVHALGPWMRRPSYLMWAEAEDTYKKEIPSKNVMSPEITPNKGHQVTSSRSSRSSRASSNIPSSPMITHRPKVRKSTTLMKIITKRDLGIDDAELVDKNVEDKARSSVNNLVSLIRKDTGYASDNEEDDIDADNIEDDLIDNENEVNCELCGRVVPIMNTSLVDSRISPNDKIRICEVCLYETDSEDETTADESGFMDVMHSALQSVRSAVSDKILPSITSSDDNNQDNDNINTNTTYDYVLNNAKLKSKEMSESITNLLSNLNDNNNIKEQLIKLQSDMKQLFNY